jgi:pyruvate kinase
VRLSFERLAEMQEELVWFGEACHLPVVWATQVLQAVEMLVDIIRKMETHQYKKRSIYRPLGLALGATLPD